ncbi:MAG: NADH-quinone oxidoreductase subunit N [Verrucomicrobiota bacterium]
MPAYGLEIAVVCLGLLLLLMDAFREKGAKSAIAGLAVIGLLMVLVFLVFGTQETGVTYWGVYEWDNWAKFYKGIALASTILVILMSVDYAEVFKRYTNTDESQSGLGEHYILPIFACAGLMWMASARDLITIFVALETVTITFYVMVAFMRHNVGSLEAGVKYLILGALSTGFLVFGITWTFGVTGAFHLDAVGEGLSKIEGSSIPALFALVLLLVGLGFKIAAVPFHLWVPDVYQGAPAPVTAFLSVGSKAAGFIILLRVLEPFLQAEPTRDAALTLLAIMAAATLLFGNLAAIPQTNVKRLLAYSSISHAGFLLVAIAAPVEGNPDAWRTVTFYLGAYLAMTMLCFFILCLVRAHGGSDELIGFSGLSERNGLLAFGMLIGLASLAGLPLTAGFFGKFFVFNLALQSKLYWLLAIAILGAAAGFYYYFKVAKSMYWEKADEAVEFAPGQTIEISMVTRVTILVLIVATLFFGVVPGLLFSWF